MNDLETHSAPPASRRTTIIGRGEIRLLVLVLATMLGIYVCWRLALPFIGPLAWALALAVMFAPAYRAILNRVRRPNLAAALAICLITAIVVVPMAFVTERLVSEAAAGAAVIKTKVETGEWVRAIESHPRIAPLARWIEENTNIPAAIGTIASWLTTQGASLVRGSVTQVIGLFLTFYLLFFFLRDRQLALDGIRQLAPLPESAINRLFRRVADTIQAIVYGTLVIACVQGTLGGLMFWWLGLAAPLLWGVVMGLLAIVPLLGAFIVWIPAAIFLAADGSWGKAIILTVWGTVVVGGIDNLLYPVLVGNRLRMHTVIAFVSVVGGLIVFGVSGVILGPVAVTVTRTLLEYWRSRNADQNGELDVVAPIEERTRSGAS
jgi:predicted PurR-regulated permease PerM